VVGACLQLTTKAKFLILWNLIVLLPALSSFLYWLLLTIRVAFHSVSIQSLVYLLFVFSILLIASSIVAAVRLKMRILSDVGDSGLRPIKRVYKGTSHINWACYIVLYPITFGINFGQVSLLSIFLVVALIVALPLRSLISLRKRQYQQIKRYYHLGQWKCPRCKVSLAFQRQNRRWVCHRCGIRFLVR